jgi:hypothetical protein
VSKQATCGSCGLLARRERNVALEPRQHLVVDQHGAVVVRAAVHHAMADRDQVDLLGVAQPRADFQHGGRQVGHLLHRIALIDQRFSVGAAGAQARPHADAVHLAFDEALEIGTAGSVQLELDARRSRVDDEDRIHGGLPRVHAAGTAAMRRRASA